MSDSSTGFKFREVIFCNAFIYLHVDISYLFYQSTNVPFYVIMQLHVSYDTSGAPCLM